MNTSVKDLTTRKSFFDTGNKTFQDEFIFLTTQHEEFLHGTKMFSMSTEHVFFWNEYSVWTIDINTDDNMHSFKKLGVYVDPMNKQSRIERIRTGVRDDIVVVVVR